MISNPWATLPKNPPYLAPCDQDMKLRDFYDLRLELLPQPYMGNLETAKVIILLLNPGYTTSESGVELQSGNLQRTLRENLDPAKSKLFFIDDNFDWTAGGRWWKSKIGALLDAGVSKDDIYRNLAVVEYFPYHSAEFNLKLDITLPSQEYGFEAVRNAVKRGATILLMRGDKRWFKAVPELKEYPNVIKPKSTRNAVLSENNLGAENFKKLVDSLSNTAEPLREECPINYDFMAEPSEEVLANAELHAVEFVATIEAKEREREEQKRMEAMSS